MLTLKKSFPSSLDYALAYRKASVRGWTRRYIRGALAIGLVLPFKSPYSRLFRRMTPPYPHPFNHFRASTSLYSSTVIRKY